MSLDDLYGQLEDQKKARTKSAVMGKISAVQRGKIKDFVKKENWDKFEDVNKDVLDVTINTPDDYTVNRMLTVSSHPNSNLQRYYAKYGKYPAVGLSFPLEFKGSFWRPAQL